MIKFIENAPSLLDFPLDYEHMVEGVGNALAIKELAGLHNFPDTLTNGYSAIPVPRRAGKTFAIKLVAIYIAKFATKQGLKILVLYSGSPWAEELKEQIGRLAEQYGINPQALTISPTIPKGMVPDVILIDEFASFQDLSLDERGSKQDLKQLKLLAELQHLTPIIQLYTPQGLLYSLQKNIELYLEPRVENLINRVVRWGMSRFKRGV